MRIAKMRKNISHFARGPWSKSLLNHSPFLCLSELYMCVYFCMCVYISMHLCYFNVCTDEIGQKLGGGCLRDANSSVQAEEGDGGDKNHLKCADILFGWSNIVLTK